MMFLMKVFLLVVAVCLVAEVAADPRYALKNRESDATMNSDLKMKKSSAVKHGLRMRRHLGHWVSTPCAAAAAAACITLAHLIPPCRPTMTTMSGHMRYTTCVRVERAGERVAVRVAENREKESVSES
jgi:hypothetical protein